ncbi:Nn.00g075110.m01.CDS01 [Neocucurbitaria sp. VM-36]
MAAPKLPFLWPMLFKPTQSIGRSSAIPTERSFQCASRPRRGRRCFTTTPRRLEGRGTQRYGKAHEPQEASTDPVQKSNATTEKSAQEQVLETVEENDQPPTATTNPSTPSKSNIIEDTRPPQPAPNPPKTGDATPLDSVLHMPSPQEEEEQRPPHLKTPPYVHHFDTYGLVRELTRNSAYSSPQSITIMKAVRQMLLDNMALAREGLVSKSNVENQTYLFRAACSELKTEIGNTRKGEDERMRTERNQLQHEVDILGQRLGQETGGLRDELKGLFDDRKMAVRQEQRVMETKIQELNYKITVALNSDARSEVEGLRWVLTRRAAITVGVSAFMLFVALRYTSYIQHQQQDERKKAPPHRPSPMEDMADNSPRPPIDPNSPTGQQEALGEELLATAGVSLA